MKSEFSVLTTVYAKERPEFFDLALRSIFDQTVPPSEVVLVKDGPLSIDLDSVIDAYRSLYPDILKIVTLPENKGSGYAANIGLKYCSHEFVARMDSDDISKQTRFEKQLKIFAQHPELAVVGGWVAEFAENPETIDSIRVLPENDSEIKRFAKSRCPISQPSVMFRKSAVIGVGGYRDWRFGEDYDLWARLIVSGAKFYNIPENLVLQRTGNGLFARRGGWSYAKKEAQLLYGLYKMGLYGFPSFLRNIIIRTTVRLVPNSLRTLLYKTFLRTKTV